MEPQQPFCHHIIAMPYPGRGHINPLVNLCKAILTQSPNILVTFVVTEEWLTLLNNSGTKSTTNLVFKTIPNVIPSEHGRAKIIPEFVEAVMNNMEAPFEKLLDDLSCPPTVIMADMYLDWVVRVGNRRNIPVASFYPMSALVFSFLQHFRLLEIHGHFPIDQSEQGDQRVDYIPGVSSIRLADLPPVSNVTDTKKQLLQRILQPFSWLLNAQCLLLPSVYELEHETVDALRSEFSFPIYTIGPCIPYFKLEEASYQNPRHNEAGCYWEWLDSQPNSSVLYISFGSFLSVSSVQMDEIAAGLRMSGVRFFWVAHSESKSLQDLSGDKGLVLPWCDQLRVLSHSSIGGFWSHCGWSSTMEGVFAGVPLLTSPILMDQIPNSKFIVDDWKIGWRVRAETRSDIAEMVVRFMDLQNDEIREMRRRAKKLKERCEKAIRKDGSTYSHIASFIRDISK